MRKTSEAKSFEERFNSTDVIQKWIEHASKALDNGYYFETIAICFNAINFILSRAIIVQANRGMIKENKYIEDILLDANNPLLGKASDRIIYKEAARIGVIPSDKQLQKLHEERNKLFHNLFFKYIDARSDKELKILKTLAINYLGMTEFCLIRLASLLLKENGELIKELIKRDPKNSEEYEKKRKIRLEEFESILKSAKETQKRFKHY